MFHSFHNVTVTACKPETITYKALRPETNIINYQLLRCTAKEKDRDLNRVELEEDLEALAS